jgi:hypothetical protein
MPALLDVIGTELPPVGSGVCREVIDSHRVVLGTPMASPTIRRTRRR